MMALSMANNMFRIWRTGFLFLLFQKAVAAYDWSCDDCFTSKLSFHHILGLFIFLFLMGGLFYIFCSSSPTEEEPLIALSFDMHVKQAKEMVESICARHPNPRKSKDTHIIRAPVDGLYEASYRNGTFRTEHLSADLSFTKVKQGWTVRGNGKRSDGRSVIVSGLVAHDGSAYWLERQPPGRQILVQGTFELRKPDRTTFKGGHWRNALGQTGDFVKFQCIGGRDDSYSVSTDEEEEEEHQEDLEQQRDFHLLRDNEEEEEEDHGKTKGRKKGRRKAKAPYTPPKEANL